MEIVLVDKNDNVVGQQPYGADLTDVIYRVSAAWISNSKGEVLLAQRALTKAHSPGAWGPSAAGTVEVGETYDENIIHEIKEEIGLSFTIDELTVGPKVLKLGKNPTRKYFTQWYYAKSDQPANVFVLQKEEVAAVKWVKKEHLLEEITEKPQEFLDSFGKIIKHIPN